MDEDEDVICTVCGWEGEASDLDDEGPEFQNQCPECGADIDEG
ncbi:hypothetical protein PSQ39_21625 [Curvibacter sp. HBC28]|uniref:Small CPxCG-related zinc finger protein n=1 Tax=Curvibacter microcysteis TaxID=3026419 RepID=A0ABT5MMQ4_9BURK|nr:hypothetical protein [Curvibacter sp. HBC28]MDD0817249.1 hypothetical protein [Curvibacter sp. HBC28]